MKRVSLEGAVCPIPLDRYTVVTMAHGGGGRLMNDLIGEMFLTAFDDPELRERHDAALIDLPGRRIAMTTDSFVVSPLFFPGGDIGCLGVYGTVNDLAMAGARPLWLSLGLILEEGLSMKILWEVVRSIRSAADESGVAVVTGDTKVVENGKGDGIYLNTTGIGVVDSGKRIGPASVREGDVLIVSGDIGRHGIAIMATREGLEFETKIVSDCASLVNPVRALLDDGLDIHCMRDMTRGGLGAAVHEIAGTSASTFVLDEKSIPVNEQVQGACEMLGLDAIHIANEGRFLIVLPAGQGDRAIEILRSHPGGEEACMVGHVLPRGCASVVMKTEIGMERIVDLPSGEQLPRIC